MLVQTTKENVRASKDASLPICCPQNCLKEDVRQMAAVQKCSGSQGGLLRFRLSCAVSRCPPGLSFQRSNPGGEGPEQGPRQSSGGRKSSLGREVSQQGPDFWWWWREGDGPHRNRQGQAPGERKLPGGAKPCFHHSAHTVSWTGLVQPCILLSREGGKEETVTRIWITCSGSNPSTETPFTSTNLSPAYNNPRQTGTQNKKGYKEIGTR